MQIFEYPLLRIAALPVESLPTATKIKNHLEELDSAGQRIMSYKKSATDLLLDFNQTISDKKNQQSIQNIRKKIFQLKQLSDNENIFTESMPPQIRLMIDEYKELQLLLGRTEEELKAEYEQILRLERQRIQELTHTEIFLKGISLSSHILYKDILKYQSSNPFLLKSDDLHTERAALKYLTRIISKTTPFSTFTNVGVISLEKQRKQIYSSKKITRAKIKSSYRISAFLVKQLQKRILAHQSIAIYLPISYNKTFKVKKKIATFVVYENSKHYFKTVDNNDILKKIRKIIINTPSITLDQLSCELSKYLNEEKDKILHYLFKLVETGLIEIELDINLSYPDWLDTLEQKLQSAIQKKQGKNTEPSFEYLSSIINHIKKFLLYFPNANSRERVEALQQLKKHFDHFLACCHDQQPSSAASPAIINYRPEILIYEDTTIVPGISLDKAYVNSFSSKMAKLFKSLQIFDLKRFAQRKAYEYFNFKYPNRTRVQLLEFYENYFKDILQPEHETKDQERKNFLLSYSPIYDKLKQVDSELRLWKELFISHLSLNNFSDEIHLDLSTISAINKKLKIKQRKTGMSFGIIFQPLFTSSQKNTRIIVNSFFGSAGKIYSRFLDLLPQKVNPRLRQYIHSSLGKDGTIVEINDPSPHNANIYPIIFPKELKIPGGRFSHPVKQQIQLTQTLLKPNKKEMCLNIYDKKTNKKIFPIDFGFQNLHSKIELFQFINQFSPASSFTHTYLLEIINDYIENTFFQSSDYCIRPRIIYSGDIVLQRKAWVINPARLPLKDKTDDNFTYFKKIAQWKKSFNMPEQVFVKRRRADLSRGNDDYKPQFINLNSPVSIILLEKIISRESNLNLIVEEAMPAGPDLLTINNKHFTTEMLIQITC